MPRKKKPIAYKGYSRVDSERQHGWLVRIRRGDYQRSRFITDSVHGGKRKSRAAAEAVYAEWVAEAGDVQSIVGKMNARNTTGFVGVHRALEKDSRYPHLTYESYVASWVDENGKRKKLGFSTNRYGKKAFKLACLAREERMTDRQQVLELWESRRKSKRKSKTTKSKTNKRGRGTKKPPAK
ncbi:MAG: hypothetical protein R3C53_05245 [Pirellulaceae bacterium]